MKQLTLFDFFSFLVYILEFFRLDRLEEWADPSNEALVSILKKDYVMINFLVNLHSQVYSQFVRQLLHKLSDILMILAVIILESLH